MRVENNVMTYSSIKHVLAHQGGLRAPKTKNGVQKPRKTPPKMVYKTFVSAVYHFHASIKLILKFAHHLLSFLRCSPPSRNQKLPKLRGPQFCRRNTKSFCDDLVRYNSQLWDTVTMKCLLLCILEHPSRGCISSQVIIFLGIIFLASNNLSRTTLFVLLSKVLRTLLHWQGYDIII